MKNSFFKSLQKWTPKRQVEIWKAEAKNKRLYHKIKNKDGFETKPTSTISFKNVQRHLYDLPYINSGGCGIAAIIMYRHALQIKKKKVKIYFCYASDASSKRRYKYNMKAVQNPYKIVIPVSHIALMINDQLVDCSGNIPNTFEHIQEVDESTLLRSLNCNNWNSLFDREHSVPVIEKKLGINIQDDINIKSKQLSLEEIYPTISNSI